MSSLDDLKQYYVIIRYSDENGFYYGSLKHLTVRLSDGDHGLAVMLCNSLLLWMGELLRLSIIEHPPAISQLPSHYQTREQAAKTLSIKHTSYVGEAMEFQMHKMIFDADGNRLRHVEPGDPFDAKFTVAFKALNSPIRRPQQFEAR